MEMMSGCKLHHDCFSCPFPDCRSSTPEAARAIKTSEAQEAKRKSARDSKRRKRKQELKSEFPFLTF